MSVDTPTPLYPETSPEYGIAVYVRKDLETSVIQTLVSRADVTAVHYLPVQPKPRSPLVLPNIHRKPAAGVSAKAAADDNFSTKPSSGAPIAYAGLIVHVREPGDAHAVQEGHRYAIALIHYPSMVRGATAQIQSSQPLKVAGKMPG
jgi:hypothetical protein